MTLDNKKIVVEIIYIYLSQRYYKTFKLSVEIMLDILFIILNKLQCE